MKHRPCTRMVVEWTLKLSSKKTPEISRIIDIIGIIGWFLLLPRSSADLPWRPWSYVLGPLLELLVAPRLFGRSRLARSLRQKRNAEMLSCLKVGDTRIPRNGYFNGENEDSPLEYAVAHFQTNPYANCKTLQNHVTAKFQHRGSRPFKPRAGFQPVRGGSLCPPMLLT